jgi:Na+/H+-dicarboxylate symporter
MTVLLSAIVRLAPLAIFVLSLALAARVGPAATGALGLYVGVLSGLCLAQMLLLMVLAPLAARVTLGRFARAAAPAQLVAFAAHSSLASLPAMLDGAERTLGLSRSTSRFALPLAVSTLKVSAPVHCLVAVFFVARLTGTPIGTAQLAALAALALAVSFSVPGVPHGAILVTASVLAAAGLPTQAVALLLAVDAVPNAFRSAANTTGNLAAAAILARGAPSPESEPLAGAVPAP